MAASWVKVVGIGCLTITGACVVLIGGSVGLAFLASRSERPETKVFRHDVPAPATPTSEGAATAAPAPGDARRAEAGRVAAAEPGDTGRDAVVGAADSAGEGRVILDLAQAEFRIEPAETGEPLRVEADYDAKRFRLEESFERSPAGGWTYRVSFRRTGSGFISGLSRIFGGTTPSVRVLLPRGAPMHLESRVRQGGAEMRLGGLHLLTAEIEVAMGGLELRVEEPLAAPMESLAIDVSMGGMQAVALGNASPRRLDASCNMGGMDLDLTGAWRADSTIAVRASMGGGRVVVPRNVRVEGAAAGRFELDPEPEVPLPTLRFSTDSSMGEIEIVRGGGS